MTCPSCNEQNPAGARFCINCGTRLAEACASCGAARIGAAKFCSECGTPFDASVGAAAVQPTAPTPVAERRLVSVLFADLVGFTPFAEERDAEDVRETLTRYFDLATEVITRYGGTVEKFIGDAVMAVWGAPVTQEDDAERSVRAALELVETVRRLGPSIQARAGVLTGEAAVTIGATNQGMVAGDLVNVAARLQSVAEPGTVLVGEPTMRAASAAIAFEEIGAQSLKGKSSPIPAWRAIRVVAERGGRGRADTLEAPFVGRADELHLLKELFHATGRDGRIRLASVTGPAGIGKSRLAWEFEKYLDGVSEDVWWHTGRSPAYGEGITFWALGEMIRRRAQLQADADEPTTRARIAETVRQHVPDEDERRWIEPALLTLLGIGAEGGQGSEQLFAAWRTFFERMADTGTLALVFEDLHWADPGTLDFIEHLLEWSRNSPIFILTLARPELLERRPDWGTRSRSFTSLYLEPLSADEMRELLAGLVPGLPDNAIRAIVGRADGVPLYAVETVRTLLAEGRLAFEDGRYVPVGNLGTIAVPDSLHALIAARLDALAPEARALVTDAAVLGQSFTLTGLASVTGQSEQEIEPPIADLVRRELLIHNRDPRSPEHGQYAFVQGLIREVAYGMLARADRKARHLAAARHFESIGSEEMSGALAGHYLAAHQNAAEGAEADAIAAQAKIALKAAAERAIGLGSHAQAVTYLRQAVPLATDRAEEAELVELAGRSTSRTAHHEEGIALLGRALEMTRQLGDRGRIAKSVATLGAALVEARQLDRARSLLTDAAAEFDEVREPGVADVYAQLARVQLIQADYQASLAAAERILPAAESMDLKDVLADTIVTKGAALSSIGRTFEGMALLRAGLELARRRNAAMTELRAIGNMGLTLANDDPLGALALARESMELTERMGMREHLSAGNAVEVALPIGEWEWARALVAESLRTDPEGSDFILLKIAELILGAYVGHSDPAGVSAVRELASREDEGHLFVGQLDAHLGLVEDRLGEARRSAENVAAVDPLNAPYMLTVAAHAAAWERDTDGLERIAAAYGSLPLRGRYVDAHGRVMRAGIDGLRGRRSESLAGFLHAAREFVGMGVVVDRALNAVDMAAVLRADAPDVKAEVDEARAVFERLGARPFLAQLDRLAGASPPPTPAAGSSAARVSELETARES